MNLQYKIKQPGHYTNKAANALLAPATTGLALLSLMILFSLNTLEAQNREIMGDTIYGTGVFVTQDIETGSNVSNVNLYITPISMAMITPDTTYNYTTDGNGWAPFDNPGLPVYIDSTTGIKDLLENKITVFPNPGSEMNIVFPGMEKGSIQLCNLSGQLIKQKDFCYGHLYWNLADLKEGMYIYVVTTASGSRFSGKFLKQDAVVSGPPATPVISTGHSEGNGEWERRNLPGTTPTPAEMADVQNTPFS